MDKIILGSRNAEPAFFDMSCRWKRNIWHPLPRPNAGDKLGGGFKIGDKAVAYVFLAHWRNEFPNRKLVVIDDPFIKESVFSKEIPLDVLFKNIADEIWIADVPNESLEEIPFGQPLYITSLWNWWNSVGREVSKDLKMEIDKIKTGVKTSNKCFATIVPVFNRSNNVWRNISVDYWLELIDLVARKVPTITISKGGFPKPDFGEFFDDLNVWEVLSLLKNSRLHISGETGFTLWAPILGTLTLAFYNNPTYSPCAPLEFSNSVIILGKNYPVQEAAQKIIQLYEHEKRNSFSNMHL